MKKEISRQTYLNILKDISHFNYYFLHTLCTNLIQTKDIMINISIIFQNRLRPQKFKSCRLF